MRAFSPFLLPLLVSVAVPAALALPLPGLLDDAGTGADAGDTAADAMPLPYGRYHGNMTPFDADWYAFPAAAASSCLRADVLGQHAMNVNVGHGGAGSVARALSQDGEFRTALAVPPGSAVRLGLLPHEAVDAVPVGPYAFGLALEAPAVIGDAPRKDAPGSRASALPVPGDCFRGVLQADGPDTDVFRFNASQGDVVDYSFAQTTGTLGRLRLENATGAVIGPDLASGGAASVVIPSTGTYYLSARSVAPAESSDYVVAIVSGPDPGSGCRPMCL